jgi:hypothetical protein
MSPVNYELELPTQCCIHPIFHTDLLTPYRETPTHRANYTRPPPELVDNEEEYVVEKVLDSRRHGRGHKLQYLIKWEGYPDSDNQWVNKEDIFADQAIREFKRTNLGRETHIRRGVTTGSTNHQSMTSPTPSHLSDVLPLSDVIPVAVGTPILRVADIPTDEELAEARRCFPSMDLDQQALGDNDARILAYVGLQSHGSV